MLPDLTWSGIVSDASILVQPAMKKLISEAIVRADYGVGAPMKWFVLDFRLSEHDVQVFRKLIIDRVKSVAKLTPGNALLRECDEEPDYTVYVNHVRDCLFSVLVVRDTDLFV